MTMKFTAERDPFLRALNCVSPLMRVAGHHQIEILKHVRLATGRDVVAVMAHNLASCCEATFPAEVEGAGETGLPFESLRGLVNSFSTGATISVSAAESEARIRSARSNHRATTLPAEDFPPFLEGSDERCSIHLSGAQIKRLLAGPRGSTSEEKGREYFAGVFLHRNANGQIAAAGSDGIAFVRAILDQPAPDSLGVIIPNDAVDWILRIADGGDATLIIRRNTAVVTGPQFRFATKLIDSTFPEYQRLFAAGDELPLKVDRSALCKALERLRWISREAALITWGDTPGSMTVSARNRSLGHEDIQCDVTPGYPGSFLANPEKLVSILSAMIGEFTEIHCVRRPESDRRTPIRITSSDPMLAAVIAPVTQ